MKIWLNSLGIIKEGRGQHFEPAVVDVFLDSLDEVLNIKEQYREDLGDVGEKWRGLR